MNKLFLRLFSLIVIVCMVFVCGCSFSPMPSYTGQPSLGSNAPSTTPRESLPSEAMALTFTCWVFRGDVLEQTGITVPAQLRLVQDPQGNWPSYLDFQLPDSLYWRFVPCENTTGSAPRLDLVFKLNHYVTQVWFTGKDGSPKGGNLAISWEDGYVYMTINEPKIHILGSIRADATVEEIKEYFSDYIKIFHAD